MNKSKKADTAVLITLCFLMTMFGLGMWAQKGLFVGPITDALSISKSAYLFSDTMRYIATAAVNIFFGYLVNKFGSKKLICAGFAALILSAILYAVGDNVIVFYVGGFVLGIGLSWVGTTIVGYIVNRACQRNKGTIMGLILCANGLGGAIASLVITPFIKESAFGYRKAFWLMAIVFAVMLVVFLIFYKEPQKVEQQFSDISDKKAHGKSWVGIDFESTVKRPYFYIICLSVFLTGLILQGVTGVYADHMRSVGLSQDYISLVAVISSVSLAAFKFLNGLLYDRWGLRATVTIDYLSAIGVMAVLYFVAPTALGMVLAVAYAILAAIALPLETVMIPIYVNDLFGEKSFNKFLGIMVSINQVGYAVGAPLVGLIYDSFGSYNMAFLICGLIMAAVLISMQFIITFSNRIKQSVIN